MIAPSSPLNLGMYAMCQLLKDLLIVIDDVLSNQGGTLACDGQA